MIRLDNSWLRILSGICTNLSAAWFATIFVIPFFARPTHLPFNVGGSILFGSMYLLFAVSLDKLITP